MEDKPGLNELHLLDGERARKELSVYSTEAS